MDKIGLFVIRNVGGPELYWDGGRAYDYSMMENFVPKLADAYTFASQAIAENTLGDLEVDCEIVEI